MIASIDTQIRKALSDFRCRIATLNERESVTRSEVSVALVDLRRTISRMQQAPTLPAMHELTEQGQIQRNLVPGTTTNNVNRRTTRNPQNPVIGDTVLMRADKRQGVGTIVDTDAIRYKIYWRDGPGERSWHARTELPVPRIDYGRG